MLTCIGGLSDNTVFYLFPAVRAAIAHSLVLREAQ